jgi:hypothetical protein
MNHSPNQSKLYAILLNGHIDARRFADLEPISVELTEEGYTRLVKDMADQSQLFGALTHIRDLGMQLIRVEIIE